MDLITSFKYTGSFSHVRSVEKGWELGIEGTGLNFESKMESATNA